MQKQKLKIIEYKNNIGKTTKNGNKLNNEPKINVIRKYKINKWPA